MPIYPQPKPGPAIFERRLRKAKRATVEDDVKAEVKRLDGHKSRWPHAEFPKYRLEAAHLAAAGMGGDPKSARMTPENLITLDWLSHRGPNSLHSGDKRIVPLTNAGTRGPCEFQQRHPKTGKWVVVARERAVGLLERD